MAIHQITTGEAIIDGAMNFPGGEAHFKTDVEPWDVEGIIYFRVDSETLDSDLMRLAMIANYFEDNKIILFIPYFPGARQDRGRPAGLEVYSDLINSMGFKEVWVLDPHSPELLRYNDLFVVPLPWIIKKALLDNNVDLSDYAGIIAPDAGAVPRASEVASTANIPMYLANKSRDFETGRLSNFTCEELPKTGKFLVVDDICDGGGTFMGLAESTGLPKERLDLWVTHGVFSGKAKQLSNAYGHIYTTDSHTGATKFKDIVDNLTVYSLHSISN